MCDCQQFRSAVSYMPYIFLAWGIFLLTGCGLLARDTDQGAAAADSASETQNAWPSDPVPYSVTIKVDGEPQDLADKMKSLSQLEQLKKEFPDSMLALERRANMDRETAVKLMQSRCYYDGEAKINIDKNDKPVKVTLTMEPGPQYTVGHADVVYDPPPEIPESFLHRTRVTGFWGLEKENLPAPEFPAQIPGVEPGKPIEASAMLEAVQAIPQELQKTGYPLARVTDSLYTLNKPERKLNASITIDPGPAAYMGKVLLHGNKEVNSSYLERLVPWTIGQEPWDDELLQDYANSLRSTGLFRSVEAKPALSSLPDDGKNSHEVVILPAQIELQEGPPRSISASARYDSDTGFGVEAVWEHRNLFHNGEKLNIQTPISQQESGIRAHFEKPAFLDRYQKLYADGAALWENTDAYQQQSVKGELGIGRHLARQWWGAISIFAEGGSLKDNTHDTHSYAVISPRGGIRYDGRNNRLNPSSGVEFELKFQPFSGYYEESFGAFATKGSVAGYYAPLGRKPDGEIDNSIVLAARVEAGAMPGASSLYSIPSSLRYFTGGAGSVRGYVYQSIGPKDSEGDPLGGRSYQVVNLEARYMLTKDIGIVPFLDGGMVYKDELPHILGEMDWGLGLGLRYYTPIGPVRLDVATPLNPIDGDPLVQFYISIGQSF